MLRHIVAIPTLAAALASGHVLAQPRFLGAAEWREDLAELVETIVCTHPDPFHAVSEDDFRAAVAALDADIPTLADRRIVVRLAQLVALVRDGHTRLAFPREHEELAFSFSHSAPQEVNDARLEFASLPLRFRVFADGVYVVETTRKHGRLLGARVLAIGEVGIDEVRRRVSTVNYVDNEMTDMLLTADRLGLPDVLAGLDIVGDASSMTFTLRANRAADDETVTVSPLPRDGVFSWVAPEESLWLSDTVTPKWARTIAGGRALYVQLNEIEGRPDVWLADFMRDRLRRAEADGVERVILDLRHNHGGSAGYNLGLINALAASAVYSRTAAS